MSPLRGRLENRKPGSLSWCLRVCVRVFLHTATSLGIGSLDGRKYAFRRHFTGSVVDRLSRRTGCGGDVHQLLVGYLAQSDLSQSERQTYLFAEVEGFLDDRGRTISQHEERQRPDGHFLAMPEVMRLWQDGQAVVNGMRARQTAAFEAKSAQQRVGFHDML